MAKHNFRIETNGITGLDAQNLTQSIFNHMWEMTHKQFNYGYMAITLDDIKMKTIEFTLCGKGKKGISEKDALMVRSFVSGWFSSKDGLTCYYFNWINPYTGQIEV